MSSDTAERLERVVSPELDEALGERFAVLDDGFVRVIDYMGTDAAIVQAARVSYGRGTKKVREDEALIRYLMRHRHTTPFEMCEIKLHVRVPMDAWRQWIRHRTASVNEYSTRYSIAIDAAMKTKGSEWRLQSKANRQGSEGGLDPQIGSVLSRRESELHGVAREIYDERLRHGVAREQARKDLPLCTYTEAYWKMDLHNLLHFLSLRMDSHAQHEIRQYANIIGHEIVARWVPITWQAFLDYRLGSLSLSSVETEVIRAISCGDVRAARDAAEEAGWTRVAADGTLLRNQERAEAEAKLDTLGLSPPWIE
jgi:thymidylate synthase (FAD)